MQASAQPESSNPRVTETETEQSVLPQLDSEFPIGEPPGATLASPNSKKGR